ncbi:hypothetical protein [Microcystis phage Mel-JY01]
MKTTLSRYIGWDIDPDFVIKCADHKITLQFIALSGGIYVSINDMDYRLIAQRGRFVNGLAYAAIASPRTEQELKQICIKWYKSYKRKFLES